MAFFGVGGSRTQSFGRRLFREGGCRAESSAGQVLAVPYGKGLCKITDSAPEVLDGGFSARMVAVPETFSKGNFPCRVLSCFRNFGRGSFSALSFPDRAEIIL